VGEDAVNRREVLKAAGAGALSVGVASGVASAAKVTEVRFCDCSQVCVYGPTQGKPVTVVMAEETDDGWEFWGVEKTLTRRVGGDYGFCFEPGAGKIIAVNPRFGSAGVGHTLVCNPNDCVRKEAVPAFLEWSDRWDDCGPLPEDVHVRTTLCNLKA
jgi:hypothetical protein